MGVNEGVNHLLTVFLSLLPKQLRLPRKIRLLVFAYLPARFVGDGLTADGNDDARLRLMVLGDRSLLPVCRGAAFSDILQESLPPEQVR